MAKRKDIPFDYGHQIAKKAYYKRVNGEIIKCTPAQLDGVTTVKPIPQTHA